jgi:nitroreductase
METEKAILGRRSVRSYLDKPVPEEVINQLLKAGAMAPSAMDAQPCRYVVISEKAKIRELSDKVKARLGGLGAGMRFAEMMKVKEDVIFYGAPLVIFIIAEKGDWSAIDCSLAAQNMMLRAYDLGMGSCFIGFARMLKDDKETLSSLGVKDSQEIFCPLIFGYPKVWPHEKNREAKIQKAIK